MPPASEIERFKISLLQRHDLLSPDGRALYEALTTKVA